MMKGSRSDHLFGRTYSLAFTPVPVPDLNINLHIYYLHQYHDTRRWSQINACRSCKGRITNNKERNNKTKQGKAADHIISFLLPYLSKQSNVEEINYWEKDGGVVAKLPATPGLTQYLASPESDLRYCNMLRA